jgi:serine phosphatase RsbU (regulator of sigma subunit)/CHASE2 domain-containing sensor protein
VRKSAPAVIVAIDEPSLARHGQWPWPRTALARLLARIAQGGPAAIGVDIVMPEADRLSPAALAGGIADLDPDLARRLARLPGNDAVLGATVRRLPVVLGVVGLERGQSPGARPGRRTPIRVAGGEPQAFVRRFAGALRSVAEIDDAASGHGLINPDPGSRVVRRLPLVAAVGDGDLLPTLGLEMLRVASGAAGLGLRVGARGVEAVTVGDLGVPTQPDGTLWLPYAPHDPSRFVSATDVLTGRADLRQFERKLVLVGVTAVGLGDHHPTPVSSRMAGVEIHAQLLEALFDGERLARPAWAPWAEAAVLAGLGLLLVVAVPAWPVRAASLLAVAALAAVIALGFLAYAGRGLLLDAATPAAGLALVFAAVLGATLAEAERQRRALRRQLAAEREAAARVAGELEAARRIQMGILPDPRTLAGDPAIGVYAYLEPARVVGGDLYDFFRLDGERLFVLVGDVSGKGVPGSLFMAVSKALCKSSALRRTGDLAAAVAEANAEISRDNPEALFVTAWAGVLDGATGRLEYCNAGHEPACVLAPDGVVRRLAEGGGPPLCVVDDFPYESAAHTLRPGETLCLITDGVTEAMNGAGDLYGRARLDAVLTALPAPASAAEVGEAVKADVARFIGGAEPSDDLTIVVVQWKGRPAATGS